MQEVAPGIAFEGLRFRFYRGAELTAFGTADRADFRRDTTDLAALRPEVQFPGLPGEAGGLLTAPAATGNARARRFVVTGGITGHRGTDAFRTERATYDGADGLLRGDRPVELRGSGYRLDGPGFTLDPRAGTIRVAGGGRLEASGGLGR